MTTASKPGWRCALWLALKIYAGFCTVILTAYFALLVWSNFVAQPPPGSEEFTLTAAYGKYMASEYPKRGDHFMILAGFLGARAKVVPVLRADVLKYLGKPDFMQGTLDDGMLIFNFSPSRATNQCEISAFMKNGKLELVGINAASASDHSGYKPYPREAPPGQ